MKLLQIVPYFIPYQGGQERYIYNLSKYLVRMGHEVDVVTSNYPISKEEELIDGIHVRRFPAVERLMRNPLTPGFLRLGSTIEEYDVIHTHNEHSSAAMAAAYYRMRYSVPMVLTCHGQLTFGDWAKDRVERIYSRSIGKMLLSRCDRVVVNSADDHEYILSLKSVDPCRIVVLHNAIDPLFFDQYQRIDAPPLSESDVNILYVGRLIRRKGLEWLIKALAEVARIRPRAGITCTLVGDGEDALSFRTMVRDLGLDDCIHFAGSVADKELVSFYQRSNLFILPSLSEVCPTVALEAMYFGLPVISTCIPGIRDHFADVAVLVPPKNEDALARAIVDLIEDPDRAARLGRAGQNLVRQKYVWNRVASMYEDVYRSLVGKA